MKKIPRSRRLFALLLALVLVVGSPAAALPAPSEEAASDGFRYEYVLLSRGTDTDGSKDGQAVLDLYVVVKTTGETVDPASPAGPLLDAGAFGLRFPEWASVSFAASSAIAIQPMVPEARYSGGGIIAQNTYHCFAWTGVMKPGASGTITQSWAFSGNLGGYALNLGSYTLSLPELQAGEYKLPARSEVGQMSWLDTAEAVAKELGESAADPNDALNLTLWNPETSLYQGYYAANGAATAEDALLVQTDIGFVFNPPKSWPSLLRILSYDPKKTVTVTVSGEGKTFTCDAPSWSADKQDTAEIYAAEGAVQNSGVGLYYTAVKLDNFSLVAGKTYTMTIAKEGHLSAEITLTATSSALSAATGYPKDGTVRLPAGDMNPTQQDGKTSFGDGRIDMADRAAIMRFLGGAVSSDPTLERGEDATQDNTKLMYYADIDGDGRVTLADLAILMSPENYGQLSAGYGGKANE